jgi:hypothetical protein
VAGQEHRSCPSRLSCSSRSRTSRMPGGSRPLVGSSSTSSRGGAAGARQAQPLAHAQAVGLAPAAVDPGQARPARAPRPTRFVGVRREPRAGRVGQPQVRPAGQVPVEGRPLDERPDLLSVSRLGLPPSSSIDPSRQHQAEQHRHVVVLPEPFGRGSRSGRPRARRGPGGRPRSAGRTA